MTSRPGSRSILKTAAAVTALLIGTAGGTLAFDNMSDEERAERQARAEAKAEAEAASNGDEMRTIHDGVFTEAQAASGREIYIQRCMSCHGNTLRGTNAAPGLVAYTLDNKYDQMPLSAYFAYMQMEMPVDRPGSLPARDYADLMAFILSRHGAEPGESQLVPDMDQLDRIMITSKSE